MQLACIATWQRHDPPGWQITHPQLQHLPLTSAHTGMENMTPRWVELSTSFRTESTGYTPQRLLALQGGISEKRVEPSVISLTVNNMVWMVKAGGESGGLGVRLV